jgi:hypothetical protein
MCMMTKQEKHSEFMIGLWVARAEAIGVDLRPENMRSKRRKHIRKCKLSPIEQRRAHSVRMIELWAARAEAKGADLRPENIRIKRRKH